MRIETFLEHTFYTPPLGPESVVLDLGANRGGFSHHLIQRFGCRCFAVEASPEVFARIPGHPRLQADSFAVTETTGSVTFYVSDSDSESSGLTRLEGITYEREVNVVGRTLMEYVAEQRLGSLDLVKLDIEGAEIGVIDTLPDDFLKNVGQFTIEFHDFAGVYPAAEVERILARFRGLGFLVYRKARFRHYDVLLLNRARLGISLVEWLWIRYALHYGAGAWRVARRLITGEEA